MNQQQEEREHELGKRWATSYDCWVDAPGSQGPIYACPQQRQEPSSSINNDIGTNEWPDSVRNLPLPIFGLTANNPLGEEKSLAWNINANSSLEKDLIELCSPSSSAPSTSSTWWNGFGFGKSFHEKGFVLSTERDIAINLAKKYQQGAIYEFSFLLQQQDNNNNNAVVRRQTIPVLVSNVEADVFIVTCPRPQLFPTSDPNYVQN